MRTGHQDRAALESEKFQTSRAVPECCTWCPVSVAVEESHHSLQGVSNSKCIIISALFLRNMFATMLMKKLKITNNAQEISGIFSGISGTASL